MRTAACRDTAAALARGWNAFFHAPCDARVCALVRIAFALVVLAHLAVLCPDRERWFTDAGVLSRGSLAANARVPTPGRCCGYCPPPPRSSKSAFVDRRRQRRAAARRVAAASSTPCASSCGSIRSRCGTR